MRQLVYASLSHEDSIRLLKLVPGTPPNQIACALSQVRLSSELPGYQALSYTWGAPTQAALEQGMSDERNRVVRCDEGDLAGGEDAECVIVSDAEGVGRGDVD